MDDELYANMLSELQLVATDRANAEKDYLELKLREDPEFILGDKFKNERRERIRGRLMKALDFNEKGERLKYNTWDGFYLYIDHIQKIHRNFPETFLSIDIIDASGEYHPTINTPNKTL